MIAASHISSTVSDLSSSKCKYTCSIYFVKYIFFTVKKNASLITSRFQFDAYN